MTDQMLEFRDSLVDLLDQDADLPELTVTEGEGSPQTLFELTAPDGLAPGTYVWFGELLRLPSPSSFRGPAGPEWDETYQVTIYVDAEVEPDGAAGEHAAAQVASVDLASRVVTSIRQAVAARRHWTSKGSGLSTLVNRFETQPVVTFQDGAAGCQTQIQVEHNTTST